VSLLGFLLIGGYDGIPLGELKSLFNSSGFSYNIINVYDRIVIVESDEGLIDYVIKRASMTHLGGLVIFTSKPVFHEISEGLRNVNLSLPKGSTFSVRVKRVNVPKSYVDVSGLERLLGSIIVSKGLRVNLDNPMFKFVGLFSKDVFVFLLEKGSVNRGAFIMRRPSNRPFFHPSAMETWLARSLVNLVESRENDIVLDPFCGTGGLLIEGGLINIRMIGIDISWEMCKGALRNIRFYGLWNVDIIRGDAAFIPLRYFSRIVTDPPYGKDASTMGRTHNELIRLLLKQCYNVHKIVYGSFKGSGVENIEKALGFMCENSFEVKIHRSLTRNIRVISR
jgi:tRNA (guanine10-N2)-dimethyltransferase